MSAPPTPSSAPPTPASAPPTESSTTGRTPAAPADAAAPPPATGDAAPAPTLPAIGPSHVLRLLGSVVAPLSVVTALMYYLGLIHAGSFFSYFGTEVSLFGLSSQDYVVRSVDSLFVPFVVAAVAALTVLWVHRLLPRRLSPAGRRRVVRAAVPAAGVLGLGLLLLAAVAVAEPAALAVHHTVPGLSLTTGTLLLLAASRGGRWLRHEGPPGSLPAVPRAIAVTEWAAVLVLASVGVFWAAGNWSWAVGRERAVQVHAGLAAQPDAVLFSERSLSLAGPGVTETACRRADAAYAFRYDGYKLVLQAGGQYLLLPSGWSRAEGPAVVLPADSGVRLEFTPVGASGTSGC